MSAQTQTVNCPRCGQPVGMDDDWEALDAFYPIRSRQVAWHTSCAASVVGAVEQSRKTMTLPRKGTPVADTPTHLLPACTMCGETGHPDGECLL